MSYDRKWVMGMVERLSKLALTAKQHLSYRNAACAANSLCFSKIASFCGYVIRTLALHPLHLKCAIALSAEPFLTAGWEQSGQSNVRATSDRSSAKPISIPFASAVATLWRDSMGN
jgi:hypothetical protein